MPARMRRAFAAALCLFAVAAAPASAAQPDCTGRGVPVNKISIQEYTFAEYIGFGTDAATGRGSRRCSPSCATRAIATSSCTRSAACRPGDARAARRVRHQGLGAPRQRRHARGARRPRPDPRGEPDPRHQGLRLRRDAAHYTTEAQWIAYAEVPRRARRAGPQGRPDADGPQPQLGVRDRRSPTRWPTTSCSRTPTRATSSSRSTCTGPRAASAPRRAPRASRRPTTCPRSSSAGSATAPSCSTSRTWRRPSATRRSRAGSRSSGRGGIDFPSIFAASKGPVKYYVIEHDPRFGDPTFNPFEAAAAGFALPELRDLLVLARECGVERDARRREVRSADERQGVAGAVLAIHPRVLPLDRERAVVARAVE